MKDLIPLDRNELKELINKSIIEVNEEIDLNENINEYSFQIKMSLLSQLNNYYDKKARKDFKEKLENNIKIKNLTIKIK